MLPKGVNPPKDSVYRLMTRPRKRSSVFSWTVVLAMPKKVTMDQPAKASRSAVKAV